MSFEGNLLVSETYQGKESLIFKRARRKRNTERFSEKIYDKEQEMKNKQN